MIQTIVRQLGEHLQQDLSHRAFVLIDPLLREPFQAGWEPAIEAPSWPLPVRHAALRQDQRPRLLQLDAHNVALLQASVVAAVQEWQAHDQECSQGYCIGGWLLADATTQGAALARHLAQCMQTSSAAAHPAGLIRWPDRRVLEWMWLTLSESQQAHLLHPLIDWSVLDRRGQLRSYRAPEQVVRASWFSLDSAQWRHAQQGETAQDLIRGWLTFADELPADYLSRVLEAVRAVEATDLDNRQDRALMGAYILQIHPRLIEYAQVREAVAAAKRGDCTLAQALERIPDPAGWDAIRDELTHGARPLAPASHRSVDHG